MSYVSDIRAKVGHAPLLLPGASVIVRRGDEVLLMRRSDTGDWTYHGGCLEPGETLEEAAARELREESGLIARRLTLVGVFAGPRQHVIYPNGDEVYYTDTLFECTEFEGEPMESNDEVLEQRWFPLAALPANTAPSGAQQLEHYLQYALQRR